MQLPVLLRFPEAEEGGAVSQAVARHVGGRHDVVTIAEEGTEDAAEHHLEVNGTFWFQKCLHHFCIEQNGNAHLDEGHVLLGHGAVARVKVRLVENEVVDVEAPSETNLVILQNKTCQD